MTFDSGLTHEPKVRESPVNFALAAKIMEKI